VKQILEIIDSLTKQFPTSDTEEDCPDVAEPHGMSSQMLDTWNLFKAHPMFARVSYLISAAMSLTVCSIKHIEWSPMGLQLISIEAAKEQLKAVDVFDAVLHTFTWFAETGYKVIQERSLRPFLYGDQRMQQFNEMCDDVMANAEQVLSGLGDDVNDFEHKVDEVLRLIAELKTIQKEGPTALWLQKRYSEVVAIKYRIVAKHKNTAIRFAPFGVGLTGPSGVGKSTLAKIAMRVGLEAMEFTYDPNRIVSKDLFDKYDSTYTSDVLGVMIDDVGNGKSQFVQCSPTDVIIKFFNNMAAQAVKAELNAKGVVFIDFKMGVLTSNFDDYMVRQYSEKPESALRRFIHTRVKVREEFRKPNSVSLDPSNPNIDPDNLTQDLWLLTIEECRVFETKQGKETYEFVVPKIELEDGRVVLAKNLGLQDWLCVYVY
jgi:hypothetical protein